jgi:hypothetical protein
MSEFTGSIGKNAFINALTAPWTLVPAGTRSLSIERSIKTACSLGCSVLFGLIPAIFCGVAARLRSKKIVMFFGAPWTLIEDDEEDALLKQALVTLASAASSFGIAHFASKHLKRSLLARSLSHISSKVNVLEWMRENFLPLRDYSRMINWLGVHVTASLVLEHEGFFRLSKETGCLNDYFSVITTHNIYISVDREFLQMYPQEVLKLLAKNFRGYIKDGNDLKFDLNIRADFKKEKSTYHPGPTREFFFLLVSGLLAKKGDRHQDILNFTDHGLKAKGCFLETSNFYRSFGVLLGAIAKTEVRCGVGNLVHESLILAILVPTEVELIKRSQQEVVVCYEHESTEIKLVLRKIASILYKGDKHAIAALKNLEATGKLDDDKEESNDLTTALMARPERALEMSLGMFEFYCQSKQSSWSELWANQNGLIGKII